MLWQIQKAAIQKARIAKPVVNKIHQTGVLLQWMKQNKEKLLVKAEKLPTVVEESQIAAKMQRGLNSHRQ